MKCQIKIVKEVLDLFSRYRPTVGAIYDAELSPAVSSAWGSGISGKAEFCVLDILDKKIIVRKGEYEIVRYGNG